MKYIISQCRDTAWNLAMEEYVLSNRREADYLILWVNRPSIVLGKFQNVFQEINVMAAERLGIPVFRRISGGGCVYHDEGNLNFSFVTDWSPEENSYEQFLEPMIDFLCRHGVRAEQSGICNISVDGKKVSGNAQAILRKRILHHGTLLFDVCLDRIAEVICTDYEHFSSKAQRSAPVPVRNLKDDPGFDISSMDALERCLLEESGCCAEDEYRFLPEELTAIEKLAETKYRTPEWNYRKAATFRYHNENLSACITADIEVKEGKILEYEVVSQGKKPEDLDEMPEQVQAIKRICL